MSRRTERFRRQPAAPLDEGPSHSDFLPLLDSEDDISHVNLPTRVSSHIKSIPITTCELVFRSRRDRLPRTHHPHQSRRLNSYWKFRRSGHGPQGASLTAELRFTAYQQKASGNECNRYLVAVSSVQLCSCSYEQLRRSVPLRVVAR